MEELIQYDFRRKARVIESKVEEVLRIMRERRAQEGYTPKNSAREEYSAVKN